MNGAEVRLADARPSDVRVRYAWADAPWWDDDQILNLNAILDQLKETYNIDENRVVIAGVSDGATGAYYIAMRDTTPFASFLPLNGAIAVLRSSSTGTDGEMFPNNFANKPFFIVNGKITLSGAQQSVTFLEAFRQVGRSV